MLRSWRGRILLVLGIVLVLAGAAALYVWIERAALAEQVIGRALAQRGIAPASFRVGFIGFRSISLYDIEIGAAGDPDAAVDSVTVTYAPGELLSGNVRSIEAGEVRLRARMTDDGFSLGALDPLLASETEPGSTLQLPPVRIETAQVTLETPQGVFLLSGPIETATEGKAILVSTEALEISETVAPARFARLVASGRARLEGGLVSFEADLAAAGDDADSVSLLHAEGRYDSATGTGTATAEGALSFAKDGLTPARLSPVLAPLYLDIDGGVSYRAEIGIDEGRVELAADAVLDKLALRETAAGSAVFSGNLHLSKVFASSDEVSDTPFRIDLKSLKANDLTRPERFAPLTLDGWAEFSQPVLVAQLVARSALPSIRGARLGEFNARYDVAAEQGSVRATGDLQMAPGKLELQTVLPLLKGTVTQMSGTVGYVADAKFSDGGISSSGQATLAGLGFVASAATVEGVDGTVRLSSLLPLRTRGVQTLKVRSVQAGVPLENGVVLFDLDQKGFRIVDATWPFAEGKLVLVSSSAAVSASDAEFLLTVENVNLAALLTLVDVPGLSATGHISGRVPVAIRNGDPILLDGNLAAQEDGVIVYQGAATTAAAGEETKLLTDALRNFHYTDLSGAISGNANGELILGLALRGANPDLYDGYPFAINVKLEGSLAEVLRRGTVGLRPLELIREHSDPAVIPPDGKTKP